MKGYMICTSEGDKELIVIRNNPKQSYIMIGYPDVDKNYSVKLDRTEIRQVSNQLEKVELTVNIYNKVLLEIARFYHKTKTGLKYEGETAECPHCGYYTGESYSVNPYYYQDLRSFLDKGECPNCGAIGLNDNDIKDIITAE